MKKFLLIIATTAIHSFSMAQVPAPGSYVTNNNVDQLIGTWRWTSGQDVVEIKLQKARHTIVDFDEDVLLGSHRYIQNGVEIQNSMPDYNNILNDHKKATVYLINVPNTTNTFGGSLRDLSKAQTNELTLIFTPGSPPTLLWTLKPNEMVTIDPNFQYGLTLPAQITLVKQ